MADLEAEMARFEAELAGVAQAAPSAGPSQATPPQAQAASYPAYPGPPQQHYMPPPPQLPYGMPPPPPMAHQHYGYPPDPAQQYEQQYEQHYDQGGAYDPLQQHPDNPQTSYTAAPQLNQGPGFDVVAAGGAAFAQKLAMANLAQHLAGNDPSKQEAAIAGVKAALASQGKKEKKPAMPREAAGKKWHDSSMLDWPENDFRIFVGDLGNEANDDVLAKAFNKYATFQKARIVRDKKSNKTKGYGFVSFSDAVEGAQALREMDGKYIGNRPCKLRKSSWQERTPTHVLERTKRKGEAGGGGGAAKKAGILHR